MRQDEKTNKLFKKQTKGAAVAGSPPEKTEIQNAGRRAAGTKPGGQQGQELKKEDTNKAGN